MMNKLLKPLLLTALAALTLQSITAQQMPYRGTLEHTLVSEQAVTTKGNIETTTLFTPEGDFTIDLGMLMRSTHQGTLEVRAANGNYRGFSACITSGSIAFGIDNSDPEETPVTYSLSEDGKAHTYRTVLQGEKIHLYEDTTLLGTHTAEIFDRMMMMDPFTGPDDKANKEGIYSEHNLIRNPGFESEGVVLKSDVQNLRATLEHMDADVFEDVVKRGRGLDFIVLPPEHWSHRRRSSP